MLGVRAISSICITRFARRKGAMIFEAKILSVHLNAYSEVKRIKYLFFIPETRDLADISLPVECHTSTCGHRQETDIRTQDTLNFAALLYGVGQQLYLTHKYSSCLVCLICFHCNLKNASS